MGEGPGVRCRCVRWTGAVRWSAGPPDPSPKGALGQCGTEAMAEPEGRPTPRSGGTPRYLFSFTNEYMYL